MRSNNSSESEAEHREINIGDVNSSEGSEIDDTNVIIRKKSLSRVSAISRQNSTFSVDASVTSQEKKETTLFEQIQTLFQKYSTCCNFSVQETASTTTATLPTTSQAGSTMRDPVSRPSRTMYTFSKKSTFEDRSTKKPFLSESSLALTYPALTTSELAQILQTVISRHISGKSLHQSTIQEAIDSSILLASPPASGNFSSPLTFITSDLTEIESFLTFDMSKIHTNRYILLEKQKCIAIACLPMGEVLSFAIIDILPFGNRGPSIAFFEEKSSLLKYVSSIMETALTFEVFQKSASQVTEPRNETEDKKKFLFNENSKIRISVYYPVSTLHLSTKTLTDTKQ